MAKESLGMKGDWSWRYHGDPQGKSYTQLIKNTHKLTNGICCECLKNPSEEIHHTSYRSKLDRAGENVFPLCQPCHKQHHASREWIQSKVQPMRRSHSTRNYEKRLKLGVKLLRS